MSIDSPESLKLIATFLLPGFLFHGFLSSIIPSSKPYAHIAFFRFLTFSLLNYYFWSWKIIELTNATDKDENFIIYGLWWVLIIFISPFVFSLLYIKFKEWEWVELLLQNLGFHRIDSIPSGWDHKFSNIEYSYILVTLEDNTKIAGYFGPDSRASSEKENRDLYLEELYEYDEKFGEKHKYIQGVWIKGDQIKYIEFFRTEQEAFNEKR